MLGRGSGRVPTPERTRGGHGGRGVMRSFVYWYNCFLVQHFGIFYCMVVRPRIFYRESLELYEYRVFVFLNCWCAVEVALPFVTGVQYLQRD